MNDELERCIEIKRLTAEIEQLVRSQYDADAKPLEWRYIREERVMYACILLPNRPLERIALGTRPTSRAPDDVFKVMVLRSLHWDLSKTIPDPHLVQSPSTSAALTG